jgi:hypothetical protein
LNASLIAEQIAMVPLWVPSSFLPFLPLTKDATVGPQQVKAIENKVLFGSRFYVTSSDSVPGAAIFRGNVRTPRGGVISSTTMSSSSANITDDRFNAGLVFQEIQSRLEREEIEVPIDNDDKDATTTAATTTVKLSDQVQLFMMVDPEWRPNRDEREPIPKPVILALSKAVSPSKTPSQSKSAKILFQMAKVCLSGNGFL